MKLIHQSSMCRKWLLVITILLLTCSCGTTSRQAEAPKKSEPVKYEFKPVEVADVEKAQQIIKGNKEKRIGTVKKGIDRKERFEPLLLKLVAFHDFGHELSLSDVEPYRKELPHISSVYTNQETNDFIRMGTEDTMSFNVLISELDKSKGNIDAVRELKEKNKKLQADLDGQYTQATINIATKFFWIGGLMCVASAFSSLSFIAPITGKLQGTGLTMLLIGGLIMLLGTFTDFARDFLQQYGQWLLLLLLVPLIVIFVAGKAKEEIDDSKDDD